MYHQVTLGGVSWKRAAPPDHRDDVVIGSRQDPGKITVGRGSRIGANAVVVKSVPPTSVVGVPGQIVQRSKPRPQKPDLDHTRLPDAIGESLISVMQRLEKLERSVQSLEVETNGRNGGAVVRVHTPEGGVWHGEDFMI